MTALPILRAGNPVLRQISEPVRPGDPALRDLVRHMLASMEAAGGVGLAAPQVGELVRLVIFAVPEHRITDTPEDEPAPLSVLVNPVIEPLGQDTAEGWEGCLSLPGLRGLVLRWNRIRYTGFDLDGRPIDRTVAGFHARVVQHECDHLDGRLYPERMRDLSTLGFVDQLVAPDAKPSSS